MARRSTIASVAALAGITTAVGCQYLAGLSGNFTIMDAGPDAMMPAPPTGCAEAQYPDPPGGTDSPTSLGKLVFAVHTIDMGDGADTPGYDLDHVCTCFEDAGPSCAGASAQLSTYCDADGGVDGQAAKFFQLLGLAVGPSNFGSAYFSAQANEGAWSILITVDGYSGAPDDPAVDVALYPSLGRSTPPAWNGTDQWPVVPTSVGDGGVANPLFRSAGAYVSGGVLVASVPITEISLTGGMSSLTVRLSSGVLTGQLVQVAGQWSLKGGVIAARWTLPDVFKALSGYRDHSGMPFCTNTGLTYTTAKSVICTDADILTDGTQPKSNPCDALSVGLGFTADPALLGGVSDAGTLTDGCSPATDPANDSCP